MMEKNHALETDMYQLTMMAANELAGKSNELSTFDLFVRRIPESRNYLLSCGLEEALNYLKNLRFTEEQISYLKSLPAFQGEQHERFFEKLRNFRFTGDVWAVKEGTPIFSNEPLLIVRAPTFEAQLVETYLLNIIGSRTMFASKASRIVDNSRFYSQAMEFGTRRSHDPEAAIACARAAYIAGFVATSNLEAGKRYGIPVSGTMAHAFVMGFASELDAFRAYSNAFPKNTVLLVDTYDIEQGIRNAITVAKEMESRGERLLGIRIDSGDLAHFSRLARNILNENGLGYVKIVISNDLDEIKITDIRSKGGIADMLGIGTMVATSNDAPHLGVVYKLSEQETKSGEMQPRIKISEGKITLPGLKQVYRFYGRDGRAYMDEICLSGIEERKSGTPLLEKVMEGGNIIVKMPTLEEIKIHAESERKKLPDTLRGLTPNKYKVELSSHLLVIQTQLIESAKAAIRNGQGHNATAKKIK